MYLELRVLSTSGHKVDQRCSPIASLTLVRCQALQLEALELLDCTNTLVNCCFSDSAQSINSYSTEYIISFVIHLSQIAIEVLRLF